MKCKNCLEEIHPKRVELGYTNCVNCSDEIKWSCIPVINHKTGNEIQIVKDPEVAAEFMAKSARIGFGTLRGISSSYKQKTVIPKKPIKIEKPLIKFREISRKPIPNDFDKVGEEVIQLIDSGNLDKVHNHIQKALLDRRIFKNHAKRIEEIVSILTNS